MALEIIGETRTFTRVIDTETKNVFRLKKDERGNLIIPGHLVGKAIRREKAPRAIRRRAEQVIALPTETKKVFKRFARSKIIENLTIILITLLSVYVLVGEWLIGIGQIDLWITKINFRDFFLGNDIFISMQIIFHFMIYIVSFIIFIKFINYLAIQITSIKQVRQLILEIEEEFRT